MRKILLIGLCALATNFASAKSSATSTKAPQENSKTVTIEHTTNESVKMSLNLSVGNIMMAGMLTVNCKDGSTTTVYRVFYIKQIEDLNSVLLEEGEKLCRFHGGCRSATLSKNNVITKDPIIRP